MPTLEEIDLWLQGAGPWLLPVIGFASFVEYVFPPFPGDTVMLAGTAAAVRGTLSPVWLLLVTSVGSLAGSVVDYVFGVWLQRRVVTGRKLGGRFLTRQRLAGLERSYRRWGLWLILANRFVPVARATFFVFAGMSGLNFTRTVVVGLVGATVWNAMIVGAGYAVGENLDELEHFARRAGTGGFLIAGAVALLVGLAFAWRAWRRRRQRVTPS